MHNNKTKLDDLLEVRPIYKLIKKTKNEKLFYSYSNI